MAPLLGCYPSVTAFIFNTYNVRDAIPNRGFVASPRAGPSIAHLETQYSWAQARTLPHSKGSRPTGMEAPATAIPRMLVTSHGP